MQPTHDMRRAYEHLLLLEDEIQQAPPMHREQVLEKALEDTRLFLPAELQDVITHIVMQSRMYSFSTSFVHQEA